MSATIVSDAITYATDSQTVTAVLIPATAAMEVEFANCECCGLTEECTSEYIENIRKRFEGKWLCGLCAEAVKDEIVRCQRLITASEALSRHFNFCNAFRSSCPPPDPTVHLIAALRQLLRKSLDSPKSLKSMPCTPTNIGKGDGGLLIRSESCMPSLSLVDSAEFGAMELQDD